MQYGYNPRKKSVTGPDALTWLRTAQQAAAGGDTDAGFADNHFGAIQDGGAVEFVEGLRKAGASMVLVGEVVRPTYAATLFAKAPAAKAKKVLMYIAMRGHPNELHEVQPGVFRIWWD